MRIPLGTWTPAKYCSGFIRGLGGNHMAPGSENGMVSGENYIRAFRGVTVQAGKVGSRVFFNVDQNYAGLGTAGVNGVGSVFGVRQLLLAIGAGQVTFAGAAIPGFIASSTLSFVAKVGGVYDPSQIYQVGHAQPTAPTIYAKDAPSVGHQGMSSAVSVVIWRVSAITGQVSLASLPSNVLVLNNQSVIVPMPALDFNGQTHWGIGVTKIGLADLGNHYELPTSLGGEVADGSLITIDAHTRSVEISWSNGALIGQRLAPDKAFSPSAGQFAGGMNDVAWLDDNGIIYVSEPNEIGSFPPSNALFANEPAVLYLPAWGMTLRFGRHSLGVLNYVGGSPALEYQEIWRTQGIQYAQNAALGAQGRLMVWLGKPAVVDKGIEPDFEYATEVLPDFAGWDAAQTANMPIVPCYDARGQYECWCLGQKVMAKFVPKNAWCSPIDLTGKVSGNIVSAVTHERVLYLCASDGATLTLYQFDAGTGSVMKIQTSDTRTNGYEANVQEIVAQGRVDNTANAVKLEMIIDFDDANPVLLGADIRRTKWRTGAQGYRTGAQEFTVQRPNKFCRSHALRFTMTGVGGITVNGEPVDCGLDLAETGGVGTEVARN